VAGMLGAAHFAQDGKFSEPGSITRPEAARRRARYARFRSRWSARPSWLR